MASSNAGQIEWAVPFEEYIPEEDITSIFIKILVSEYGYTYDQISTEYEINVGDSKNYIDVVIDKSIAVEVKSECGRSGLLRAIGQSLLYSKADLSPMILSPLKDHTVANIAIENDIEIMSIDLETTKLRTVPIFRENIIEL